MGECGKAEALRYGPHRLQTMHSNTPVAKAKTSTASHALRLIVVPILTSGSIALPGSRHPTSRGVQFGWLPRKDQGVPLPVPTTRRAAIWARFGDSSAGIAVVRRQCGTWSAPEGEGRNSWRKQLSPFWGTQMDHVRGMRRAGLPSSHQRGESRLIPRLVMAVSGFPTTVRISLPRLTTTILKWREGEPSVKSISMVPVQSPLRA